MLKGLISSCSVHTALLLDRKASCITVEEEETVTTRPAGFMSQQLQIPPDIVAEQCLKYYLNYGTTLSGLVVSTAVAVAITVFS